MIPILFVITFVLACVCTYLYWTLRKLKDANGSLSLESSKFKKMQDNFLNNVSHEMRTPLIAIKGFTELITDWAKEQQLPGRYTEALAIMRRNETRLLNIISSMLDFCELRSGNPISNNLELVSVTNILDEIKDLVQFDALNKGLYLNFEVSPNIPFSLFAHAHTLRLVLTILIQNALKFTHTGGVLVTAQLDKSETLVVDVIDSGIGIDTGDLANIFKPFFQVDSTPARSAGGLGIGLSVCKLLVDSVKGHLKVESTLGHGTRFQLTLPVIMQEKDSVVALNEASQPPPRLLVHEKKTLIAEDSQDSVVLVRAFLKGFMTKLETAENGKEAVELILKAEKTYEPFEIVLMDMQMPIMSGYQATRLLRQRGFTKPIIAITSHNRQGDREKCLEAGCTDYIAKPLEQMQFATKMEQYFEHRQMFKGA